MTKRYGPVLAVDDVDLELRAGEVHALLGQNGSGKSTIAKMLSGIVRPDRGSVLVDGEPVAFDNPSRARRRGIATVFQELSVLPSLTVAENIFVERAPHLPLGPVRRRRLNDRAAALLDRFQIDLAPRARCGDLSLLEMQLVEIARALATEPRLLILDEATSALDQPDALNLLRIARELAAAGAAILFVSHRLDEIFHVADRISVLVDGALVASANTEQTDRDTLLNQLLGRTLKVLERVPPPAGEPAAPVLSMRMPGYGPGGDELELDVRPGEILGLAGLQGHGQKDVLRALGGDNPRGATIAVEGRTVRFPTPHRMISHGVVYVPEDRAREGLFLGHSVRVNTTLSALRLLSRGGFLRPAAERAACAETIEQLSVRTASQTIPVGSLSGGNQQKVLIGRALLLAPRVVLLDDPTRGIDVGAKDEIYEVLRSLAAKGVGIVFNSTEIPELIGLCHRVIVFHDGRAVAELVGEEIDNASILEHMLGAAA
ncbi:MAG TPA: sugar ABC transporter ATP-binding protein [Solirubrobacterales bacterium]|nr:sugar ABC transporter ATP-binding protein [Solirubrobacterales bacterium]